MSHRLLLRAALAGAALSIAAPSLAAAAAPIRILPLGDSITQGAGGDYTWRYDLWKSLNPSGDPEVLDFVGDRTTLFNAITGKQDNNRLYIDPDFDQDHNAIWSRSTQDGATSVGPLIKGLAAKPDVILVHLGTNDAKAGATKTAGWIRTLIANARAAAPGVDVVVGRLYPLYANSAKTYQNSSYVRDLNAGVESLATSLDTPDQRVVAAKTDQGFDAAKHSWDGRHPTTAGESIIAAGFADALATLGIGNGATPGPSAWPLTGPTPTVVSNASGAATSTWKATVPGAISYRLERRNVTANSAWSTIGTIAAATTSNTQTGLVRGDTYAFKLTPVRGTMLGQPSPEVEVIVTGTATYPAPPKKKPWWQWW